MATLVNERTGLIALQIAAFWPVWQWYAGRLSTSSDETWGLVALGVAALFLLRRGHERKIPRSALLVPTALVLVYAASFPFLPPLARAVIAITSIGFTVGGVWAGSRLRLPVWGLLVLSLPVLASAQFYLGYPMRALTAGCASAMLRFSGFAVGREGTALVWRGDLILVDAPCSGVRMLWVGLFLALTLACALDFGAKRTILASACAVAAVLAGNVLRASALFVTEAGVIDAPAWAHEGVGVVVFLATAVTIAGCIFGLEGRWREQLST